jgi:hypothetical protein
MRTYGWVAVVAAALAASGCHSQATPTTLAPPDSVDDAYHGLGGGPHVARSDPLGSASIMLVEEADT